MYETSTKRFFNLRLCFFDILISGFLAFCSMNKKKKQRKIRKFAGVNVNNFSTFCMCGERDSFSYFVAWWHFELGHPPLLCWFEVFFYVFVYFCLSLHWMDLLRTPVKPTDVEYSSLKSSSLICSVSYCWVSTKNMPTTKPKRMSWCNLTQHGSAEWSDPNHPFLNVKTGSYTSVGFPFYFFVLVWLVQNVLKEQFCW